MTRVRFDHWEVGFGKNMSWEMGLERPLQDPLCTTSLSFSVLMIGCSENVISNEGVKFRLLFLQGNGLHSNIANHLR